MKLINSAWLLVISIGGTSINAETRPNAAFETLMNIPEALAHTQGEGITIAIINTGMNLEFFDKNNLALNLGESGNGFETDGIDNDNNGYIDDVYGISTFKNSGDPSDTYGLGTFIASLLVSPQYGIAPAVKIIPIAVTNEYGAATYEGLKKALDYAVHRGASLIHLTLGGAINDEEHCKPLTNIQVPIIMTGGNSAIDLSAPNRDTMFYPLDCRAPHKFVLASSNEQDHLESYSNYGKTIIDAVSPAHAVWGLFADGAPTQITGGSVAAAYAAGVAALVMSYHPDWSPAHVFQAMRDGADTNEALQDKTISGGRINALNALQVH